MAQANQMQIEKLLKGVSFPVRKTDLMKYAEQQGADRQIREVLAQLPDQTFEKPADISKAISAMDRGVR
ncbi:MAG: DUF2795 domain-containing protein [Chloroflexi bacterium]|nr:DUF2795 domain-containing protein [Chloroflexota bacterium]